MSLMIMLYTMQQQMQSQPILQLSRLYHYYRYSWGPDTSTRSKSTERIELDTFIAIMSHAAADAVLSNLTYYYQKLTIAINISVACKSAASNWSGGLHVNISWMAISCNSRHSSIQSYYYQNSIVTTNMLPGTYHNLWLVIIIWNIHLLNQLC